MKDKEKKLKPETNQNNQDLKSKILYMMKDSKEKFPLKIKITQNQDAMIA